MQHVACGGPDHRTSFHLSIDDFAMRQPLALPSHGQVDFAARPVAGNREENAAPASEVLAPAPGVEDPAPVAPQSLLRAPLPIGLQDRFRIIERNLVSRNYQVEIATEDAGPIAVVRWMFD